MDALNVAMEEKNETVRSRSYNNETTVLAPYEPWQVILIIALTGVTSLITVVGNLIVIVSFIVDRAIRQPTNYFIASLAVSDLLIGAISMPFYTVYLLAGERWRLGELFCDLWLSVDYTVCLCSIYTVFFITIDRFCSVKIPAKYRSWRTERRVLCMVAMTWVLPIGLFFTSIFGWQYFVGGRTVPEDQCYVQYMEAPLFSCLLQVSYFWITLVVMIALYVGIYKVVLRLQQQSDAKEKNVAAMITMTTGAIERGGGIVEGGRAGTGSKGKDAATLTAKKHKIEQRNSNSTNQSIPSEQGDSPYPGLTRPPSICHGAHHAACRSTSNLSSKKRSKQRGKSVPCYCCISRCAHEDRQQSSENGHSNGICNKHIKPVPAMQVFVKDGMNANRIDEHGCQEEFRFEVIEPTSDYHERISMDVVQAIAVCNDDGGLRFVQPESSQDVNNLTSLEPEVSPGKLVSTNVTTWGLFEQVQRDDAGGCFSKPNVTLNVGNMSTTVIHTGTVSSTTSQPIMIVAEVDLGRPNHTSASQISISSSTNDVTMTETNRVTALKTVSCQNVTDSEAVASAAAAAGDSGMRRAEQEVSKIALNGRLSAGYMRPSTSSRGSNTLGLTPGRDAGGPEEGTYLMDPPSRRPSTFSRASIVQWSGGAREMCRSLLSIAGGRRLSSREDGEGGVDDGGSEVLERRKQEASRRRREANTNRARKALRVITIILGAFVLCWTPWHILSLVIGFCQRAEGCVPPVLYNISYWLCYVNSPMNPLCYALANQQFKRTFTRIIKFDFRRI